MTQRTTLIGLTVVVLVVVGCTIAGIYVLNKGSVEMPRGAIEGELSFSNPPALNQTATLTYRMENIRLAKVSLENGEVVSARIVLPEGLVWVSGSENSFIWENRYLMENIRIFENVPAEISGMVKAIKTGRWTAEAFVAGENAPLNLTMNNPIRPWGWDGGALVTIRVTENSAWLDGVDWPNAPISRSPMDVILSLSDDSLLNHTVDLRVLVSSMVDAPNTTIEIALPDGFMLVSGEMRWYGDIYENSSIELNATIMAVKLGDLVIKAQAKSVISDMNWFGDTDQLFISILEDNVFTSHSIHFSSPSIKTITVDESQISPQYRVRQSCQLDDGVPPCLGDGPWGPYTPPVLDPSPSGTITIIGRALYWDEHDEYLLPLRWANVQGFDGSRYLGSVLTDSNGEFTFGPISNRHEDGTGLDIQMVVVADTGAARVLVAYALDLYEIRSNMYLNCADGLLDIGDLAPSKEEGGAWRLFKYTTDAWDYLRNGPAQYSPDRYEMAKGYIRWPREEDPGYSLFEDVIYVPGDNLADRDPDVVQHEYGHSIMDQLYPIEYFEGHVFNLISNSYIAWIEGWADFFPLAVQNNDEYFYPGHWYYWVEERMGSGQWPWDSGDMVEGNVAASLWDIYDNQDDGFDQISLGFGPIWETFMSQAPYPDSFFSFLDFWNGFKTQYYGDAYRVHFAKLALYQNTINYSAQPTCTITQISGWQIPPITLSATASDPDWEDLPYLSVLFQYSREAPDYGWVDIGTDSTPPYSITWNPGFYDNTVWARAFAMDGIWYAPSSATGPFGIAQPLVGYWPFDEGSGTVAHDESGYGNNGTIYSVQWVIGRVENALLFRGGYVGVPNSGSLQISGGITVEAWVKRDTIGRIDGLLLKRSGEAGFGMNIHSAFGDKIIFYTGKTSYGGLIGNTKIQAGQWYHIAGVYDNAVGRKIYVNGELDASDSVSGQLGANTAWLNIGQYTSSYPFSGIIDEVRIYNRALSENEIKQHYSEAPPLIEIVSAPSTVEPDNSFLVTLRVFNHTSDNMRNVGVYLDILDNACHLVRENGPATIDLSPNENRTLEMSIASPSSPGAYTLMARAERGGRNCVDTRPLEVLGAMAAYWPLDESSGITAHDNSGNGNDGTLLSEPQWVIGKFGNALRFDGKDDYVRVPNSPSLQISNAITIEAWVKRDMTSQIDGLLLKRSGERGFGMNIHTTFGEKVIFYTGATHYGGVVGNTAIQAGQWYHIVGVYDNAVGRKIYVNGELDASDSVSGQLSANTAQLDIGRYTYSYPFWGIIDEIRIYNRALSADEIRAHYQAGAQGLSFTEQTTFLWAENIGIEAKESQVYDVGRVVSWDNVEWDAAALNDGLLVEIRTADDNMTWSAWRAVGNGGRLTQAARYLQCRAKLRRNEDIALVTCGMRIHFSPLVEAHPPQVIDNSAAENMRRPIHGDENRLLWPDNKL